MNSYTTGFETTKRKRRHSEEDVLRKAYIIKAVKRNNNNIAGYLSFPKCMIGKRVKIVSVEEKR